MRIFEGEVHNPLWSPTGELIVYAGPQEGGWLPLRAVDPEGNPVELTAEPDEIRVHRFGVRFRFTPDGAGLVFLPGWPKGDFRILDLGSRVIRPLAELDSKGVVGTFDVSPDGKSIVFDRRVDNSDLVLIELDAE